MADIRSSQNIAQVEWVLSEIKSFQNIAQVEWTETPAGWTGKMNRITNPGKINGVSVANISKVMGH